ncbi:MAG: hypothetical protein J6C34_01290 [Oscillospiraceae bacterium]|nr:hypothetical protein [Oscillospiraceae bacterium]
MMKIPQNVPQMFRKFYYKNLISFDKKIRINKTKSGLKSKDFKPLENQKGLFPLAPGKHNLTLFAWVF